MSILAAWLLYPALLLGLCIGLGLLVDALCARRLPGSLLAPVGLAAMVVIGQFTTLSDAAADLTVPAVTALAVLGVGMSIPWRFGRPDPLPAAAAFGVFMVFAAPIVLSGEPTFAGFIKLDDTATWLAMTDHVMEHGRDLSSLETSTYRATLDANIPGGYPIGAFVPFGTAQKLIGGDAAWVFQPYLSFLAAMLALVLWEILKVVERPGFRAAAAFVAAQPALLYGYAMWGGVKEMAAAALIALAAGLAPGAVRNGGGPRDVVPTALAAAALVGVLSPAGMVWLSPLLLTLVVIAWRQLGLRVTLGRAAAFAGMFALLVVPAVISGLVPPTSKPLVGSDGEGNLHGALNVAQVLGIWPSGDFRDPPDAVVATAVLVALAAAAALLGFGAAWRHRATAPLLLASTLLACAAIVLVGSPWAGAKALATASPAALALAALGALAAVRIDRLAGGLLVVLVAAGALWSNVLAYGGVSLAPYGQLRELQRIGDEFAGEGPALMTEYSPFGARHFLRDLNGEAASELRERTVPLRGGGVVEKGYAVDTDELDLNGLLEFRTLVLRRSPVRSRPPSLYRLAWAGRYYEVWQRPEGFSGLPPEALALGEELDPAAVPDCSEVKGLALLPLTRGASGVRVLAARHAPVYDATDGELDVPRAGEYVAWLRGSARGSIELLVDGGSAGEVRHELNNEGSFMELGSVRLDAGRHRAELRFDGADLHPGSGGFPRPGTGPLLFVPADREEGEVVSLPIEEAGRLCGRRWDWIEAVTPE